MQYKLRETAENIFVEDGAQLEFEFQEHTARTILSLQDQFECPNPSVSKKIPE